MSISLKEKEIIMRSLLQKIDYKIKMITQQHPYFEHELFEKAKKRCYKEYGIEEKVKKFEKQLEKLWKMKDETEELYCQIVAEVVGKTTDDVRKESQGYNETHIPLRKMVDCAKSLKSFAEKDMQFHADQVMQEDELGRKIHALREQKKFVSDAVMLATTSAKLYPLYAQVLKTIGESETPLLAAGMDINGRSASEVNPT